MANITSEHLHHMARRHHATMQKLDGIKERVAGYAKRGLGTVETAAGAWLGGALEGKTQGGTFLNLPYNLLAGGVLLVLGHWGIAGERSEDLNNVGNGFIGSYLAATGYQFGKNWRDTGKLLGGHSWSSPYGAPAAPAGPAVSGDLNEQQMAAIVARMQAAAGAPQHP